MSTKKIVTARTSNKTDSRDYINGKPLRRNAKMANIVVTIMTVLMALCAGVRVL